MVLDLVAEVSGGHVEEGAALDVRGPEQLAHVPASLRLALDLLLAEGVGLVGEVTAEDDRVRPDVADDVRGDVRPERGAERAPELAAEGVERPVEGRGWTAAAPQ